MEQEGEVRDCENCKHHILNDYKNMTYGCESWECKFESKEPTTKNDLGVDCISRAEAIRVASGYCHPSNVAKELAKLPSVTPQPKTGHWIFVGEENEEETKAGNFRYVCSECGFTDVHGKSTYVPYCWQCGAKMGESEEE